MSLSCATCDTLDVHVTGCCPVQSLYTRLPPKQHAGSKHIRKATHCQPSTSYWSDADKQPRHHTLCSQPLCTPKLCCLYLFPSLQHRKCAYMRCATNPDSKHKSASRIFHFQSEAVRHVSNETSAGSSITHTGSQCTQSNCGQQQHRPN